MFYHFVMTLHAVDTLVPARLLKKSYKVGSIGPLCSKMLMNFARRALDASVGPKAFHSSFDDD